MTETTLHGSCLCGSVRYTARGEQARFYHCHCQRCRKASGSAHSSNLFVKGELEFESGEDLVRWYKLPTAEHFGNPFCSRCGGRVPRAVPDFGIVFIPAGSLDDEPALAPQARIFTASSAAWSCKGDGIPCFEESATGPGS